MDKMNCEVTISAQFQITTPVVKPKQKNCLFTALLSLQKNKKQILYWDGHLLFFLSISGSTSSGSNTTDVIFEMVLHLKVQSAPLCHTFTGKFNNWVFPFSSVIFTTTGSAIF